MGNLSEHFSKDDFSCKCKECQGKFKISLGLVGILEHVRAHFKRRVNIVKGFQCCDPQETANNQAKNYHLQGKAVDFVVEKIPVEDIYRFVTTLPEIKGIKVNPKDNFVHIDLREKEKVEMIFENNRYVDITEEKKKKFNLGPVETRPANQPQLSSSGDQRPATGDRRPATDDQQPTAQSASPIYQQQATGDQRPATSN